MSNHYALNTTNDIKHNDVCQMNTSMSTDNVAHQNNCTFNTTRVVFSSDQLRCHNVKMSQLGCHNVNLQPEGTRSMGVLRC